MELPSGVIFYSPNKARMLGRSDERFVHYQDFMQYVHPEDQDRIMKNMRDHMTGKSDSYEVTYRIQKKDGSYTKFLDRGKIVAKHKGEITIAGIVTDATRLNLSQ